MTTCPMTTSPCFQSGIFAVLENDCPEVPATDGGFDILAKPLDLYVAPGGNDDNCGVDEEAPLLTIAAALATTTGYVRNGYPITINLAEGVYLEDVDVDFQAHYSRLVIKGRDMPVIEGRVHASGQGRLLLDGVHVKQSADKTSVRSLLFALVEVKDCLVTASLAGGYAMTAQSFGLLRVLEGVRIEAASSIAAMIAALNGGNVSVAGTPVVCNGVVTGGTIVTSVNGVVTCGAPVAITGTVTGPRYQASSNSTIYVQGGTATSLPGTVAGTVATGGLYMAP